MVVHERCGPGEGGGREGGREGGRRGREERGEGKVGGREEGGREGEGGRRGREGEEERRSTCPWINKRMPVQSSYQLSSSAFNFFSSSLLTPPSSPL